MDSDSGRGCGRGPRTWKLGNDRHMEMTTQTISQSDNLQIKFVFKFPQ